MSQLSVNKHANLKMCCLLLEMVIFDQEQSGYAYLGYWLSRHIETNQSVGIFPTGGSTLFLVSDQREGSCFTHFHHSCWQSLFVLDVLQLYSTTALPLFICRLVLDILET